MPPRASLRPAPSRRTRSLNGKTCKCRGSTGAYLVLPYNTVGLIPSYPPGSVPPSEETLLDLYVQEKASPFWCVSVVLSPIDFRQVPFFFSLMVIAVHRAGYLDAAVSFLHGRCACGKVQELECDGCTSSICEACYKVSVYIQPTDAWRPSI